MQLRLPTPVFSPGKLHGLYSPWGRKESYTTERLSLQIVSPAHTMFRARAEFSAPLPAPDHRSHRSPPGTECLLLRCALVSPRDERGLSALAMTSYFLPGLRLGPE